MGKRFGRNQKRRMREQAANLQEALERDGSLLHYVSEKKRELEQVMDRARRILGSSIALPPELRGDHPYPLGGDFGADVLAPMPLMPCADQQPAIGSMHMKIARMHELLTWIEDGRVTVDGLAIHFCVQLDSGKAAYAISRRAIERLSAAELQRTIAPQIALELAGHLARAVKGGW